MSEEFAASLGALREAIVAAWRPPEPHCIPPLVAEARLSAAEALAAEALARRLVEGLRAALPRGGGVDALMREFSLSSQEGVALMCLAEALLRIPDRATADSLIRDKLRHGHWEDHLGHSPYLFVNAAAWGLMLTGRLVKRELAPTTSLKSALGRILSKGGEPLIRAGMDLAMRLLGERFVAGHDIEQALERSRRRQRQGYHYSFDMLGEAAMTEADARAYFAAYQAAVQAVGREAALRGPRRSNGISIKLSALHPRYTWSQAGRVASELTPRLTELCRLARNYDIGVNVDAEESERLGLSLDILERLARDPSLDGWEGLGFVVQAYQKRAPAVIDWLVQLARETRRPLMIRLVKGAYWDAEIKRTQVEGLADYPVYTRKAYTDVAYLACARRLLAARQWIYPQFATHNAHTLAAVQAMVGAEDRTGDYEFQCLHGMGEGLYDQLVRPDGAGPTCRIYAPVGSHRTLLPYLVRRLLENGANSGFVYRVVDESIRVEELLADPVAEASALAGAPHPLIPLPAELYAPLRTNARGLDLADATVRSALSMALAESRRRTYTAAPLVPGGPPPAAPRPVTNPADRAEVVGTLAESLPGHIDLALACATAGAPEWAATAVRERAACLERAAEALEQVAPEFMALLVREAGKTWAAALAEVRETVDYCRYYAARARADWIASGPPPLGPVVCISPWNFPLAIFAGQVTAALVAGNPVLAKPAAQTSLVAVRMVELLHAAGVPKDVLQCLPGPGATVGTALVADPRTQGVMFTGSTAVARGIHRLLAARGDVPLVAETGGQNAMIVDSSALPEQVVADVLASAFDSAGQRCSALRLLCLQEEIAGPVMHMLKGALVELQIGPPEDFASDLGPLIDDDAVAAVECHCDAMIAAGREVLREELDEACESGSFLAPTLVTIHAVSELKREVFGPVLHVLRYRREQLPQVLEALERTGYGLTLGIHSRIEETANFIVARARVGNIYVNRNMIGAVVGVQPFGGEGLSGTGPKAGGPFYLGRLVRSGPLPRLPDEPLPPRPALEALAQWLAAGGGAAAGLDPLEVAALEARIEAYRSTTLAGLHLPLPGPTGEGNHLHLLPRGSVRCLAHGPAGWLHQLAAVLATANRAQLEDSPAARALLAALPAEVVAFVDQVLPGSEGAPDAVLCDGPAAETAALRQAWAERPGPLRQFLIPSPAYDLLRLLREQTISVNTAAAGGNAALISLVA
jgi:RHH-type transcriptional regulator, proline utilization regulon repressor / proline dehydrogenase / delta 1-pyrroline-5-carboxylate dehydrogenase